MKNNAHENLRQQIDLFPIGFPRTDECMRILELLFSESEAHIAAHVPHPPLAYTSARVAQRAGVGRPEASRTLRRLAKRGLIAAYDVLGSHRYHLIPAVPGFIELQFMDGRPDAVRREVGALWHKAMDGEFGRENYGYALSGARVIPVRKTVDTSQSVFAFEEAETLFKDASAIAVTNCACRTSAEHPCGAPLEVCFMINMSADYTVKKGLARMITRREAVKILEESADAGLVHTTSNTLPPVQILCNCCRCCCATLYGVTMLGSPADTVRSNFYSRAARPDDCVKCKTCVKACPVKAVSLESGSVHIDMNRCIGCGVCARQCPNNVLELDRRSANVPPKTTVHVVAQMIQERGKADRALRAYIKELI